MGYNLLLRRHTPVRSEMAETAAEVTEWIDTPPIERPTLTRAEFFVQWLGFSIYRGEINSTLATPAPVMGRQVELAQIFSKLVTSQWGDVPDDSITEEEAHCLMLAMVDENKTQYRYTFSGEHVYRVFAKTKRQPIKAPYAIVKYTPATNEAKRRTIRLEDIIYLFQIPNYRIGIDLSDPGVLKTIITCLIRDTTNDNVFRTNADEQMALLKWIFKCKIYTQKEGYLFPLLAYLPQIITAMVFQDFRRLYWRTHSAPRMPPANLIWESRMQSIHDIIKTVPHPYTDGAFIKIRNHGIESPYIHLFAAVFKRTEHRTKRTGDGQYGECFLFTLGAELDSDVNDNLSTAEIVVSDTFTDVPVAACVNCGGHSLPPVAASASRLSRALDYVRPWRNKETVPASRHLLPLPGTLDGLLPGKRPRPTDLLVIQTFYEGFDSLAASHRQQQPV